MVDRNYNAFEYSYLILKYKHPGGVKKFVTDFSAGAASACIAKTVIAPIERVKLILQLQASQQTIQFSKRYKGLIDCLVRLPKEQGFLSFWRGNVSNMARAASQESLGIAFKEVLRKILVNDEHRTTNYKKFLGANLLAGGLAGMGTFLFIYPLDFSRTRLAVDMGKDQASREFRGLIDCFIKVAKKDGLEGLYRGFYSSMFYIFLYRSAYYGLFDSLKVFTSKSGSTSGKDVHFVSALAIGQISALVAAIISYPLDTIRRRLMMQSGRDEPEYKGARDCFRKIYQKEGSRAFFNGFFVNAIRGFGAALVLAIYNDLNKYLS
ncbi:hypothetical protein ACQ4LE_010720 [Meloidogyne hapla]|uniref:ADP/ATP translocase n=1 Tax=Meloidogyne hapla TaxID=6305 RepID=A0A1I8C1N3_MELHA